VLSHESMTCTVPVTGMQKVNVESVEVRLVQPVEELVVGSYGVHPEF